MRIFEYDVCGTPFEHKRGTVNDVQFYIEPVDTKQTVVEAKCEDHGLIGHKDKRFLADYHICPKCFNSIKDLLSRLRDESQNNQVV